MVVQGLREARWRWQGREQEDVDKLSKRKRNGSVRRPSSRRAWKCRRQSPSQSSGARPEMPDTPAGRSGAGDALSHGHVRA